MNLDHDVALEPEPCLTRSRAIAHRGGTLIAEDVHDLGTHDQRLADPSGYRPAQCPRCGSGVLHVHDYPRRKLRGGSRTEIRIIRYLCAYARCAATWRILPAFVARHLWRAWETVAATVSAPPAANTDATTIPRRTARRWHARLQAPAKHLIVLLATTYGSVLETIAKRAGLQATRSELVDHYAVVIRPPVGRALGHLASLVHRLEPGFRLM